MRKWYDEKSKMKVCLLNDSFAPVIDGVRRVMAENAKANSSKREGGGKRKGTKK